MCRRNGRNNKAGCGVGLAETFGLVSETSIVCGGTRVGWYSEKIETLLMDGLQLFRPNVANRSVLLKPNLVEDLPGPVNTNSVLVGAAARCFLRLGAGRVVIGEGPGHQRDTELVVLASGLKPHLGDRQIEFVDLNRDELRKVHLKASYSGLGTLWLPRTVLICPNTRCLSRGWTIGAPAAQTFLKRA
jgi:uncharacterized protein DUF362